MTGESRRGGRGRRWLAGLGGEDTRDRRQAGSWAGAARGSPSPPGRPGLQELISAGHLTRPSDSGSGPHGAV